MMEDLDLLLMELILRTGGSIRLHDKDGELVAVLMEAPDRE